MTLRNTDNPTATGLPLISQLLASEPRDARPRTTPRRGWLLWNVVSMFVAAGIMIGASATASAQSSAEMQDRAQTWFHEAWTAARELPDTRGYVFHYRIVYHYWPQPDRETLLERIASLPPGRDRDEAQARLAVVGTPAAITSDYEYVGQGEDRWRLARILWRGHRTDSVYSPDATWVLDGSNLVLLNATLRDNDRAQRHGLISRVRELHPNLSDLFWGGLGTDRLTHGLRPDPLTLSGTDWTVLARLTVGDEDSFAIEYRGDWDDSKGLGTVRRRKIVRSRGNPAAEGMVTRYTGPTVCPKTGLLTYELVERLESSGEPNTTLRSRGFHEIPGGVEAAFLPPTEGTDPLRGKVEALKISDHTQEHDPEWMTRPANYMPAPTLKAAREAAAAIRTTSVKSTPFPAALPQTEDPVGGSNMLMFVALGVVVLGVVVLVVLKVRGAR